jgi:hypothetical protein
MDHKNSRRKTVNMLKRIPAMQFFHQKVHLSQQGASSSGKQTQGAGTSSQHWVAEKTTGGRDSQVVRNLPMMVKPTRQPAVLANL